MPTLFLSDDAALYYERFGEDDPQGASPLVFLNGMTQTTRSWRTLARRMTSPRRAILTYDARGQGQSQPGERALTLDLHASDLIALLDHLAYERAHLIGFSHGARVALAVAAHHPERVDRLVLCSATARPTALARTILASWRATLKLGGLEAMSWAALPMILGDAYLAEHEALIPGIIAASVQRNQPEGVARLLEAMNDYEDLSDLAARVSAPTLVISGEQDVLVEAQGAARLAELCGGADHLQIPNSGHTVPIEAAEAFEAAIAPFLDGDGVTR